MEGTTATVGILLAGICVVVGGVLLFRLHAFLALVLGACVVAALTPTVAVKRYALGNSAFPVVDRSQYKEFVDPGGMEGLAPDHSQVFTRLPAKATVENGQILRFITDRNGSLKTADEARLRVVRELKAKRKKGGTDNIAVLELIRADKLETNDRPQPGDFAITPDALRGVQNLSEKQSFITRVADGFGSTCGKIGILIALASIVGMCLLESGAADRIVRSTLKRFGERGAPASFLTSGFLLGIPVFFDTVFYLMIPLGKAMRMRTGRNYLLYVLTIVAGATMAHSLVPPTPGPLFVAEQLGVDIGVMILAGCAVGFFTVLFGYVYAGVVNRIWDLPLRESPDFSLSELEAISQRDESELPPFWLSLLPILLPVILIGGYTVLKRFGDSVPATILNIFAVLGDKNIALGISAAIAMATLIRQKKTNLKNLTESVQNSLSSGGVIILITAAGGAFGTVLKQTGVASLIRDLPDASSLAIIGLAFLITTAIRTAQGSATVAMITAVGILSGIAASGQLAFHPVYLALAIGCGSKPVGWMNDSGFWVITKMSGMTEAEGLKYVTPMTSAMGVVGLIATMIGVTLFPNF